eukprot:scaffold39973_cov30-Tisochrysis_lutea.AAC.2
MGMNQEYVLRPTASERASVTAPASSQSRQGDASPWMSSALELGSEARAVALARCALRLQRSEVGSAASRLACSMVSATKPDLGDGSIGSDSAAGDRSKDSRRRRGGVDCEQFSTADESCASGGNKRRRRLGDSASRAPLALPSVCLT